jgi:hypothetical protein
VEIKLKTRQRHLQRLRQIWRKPRVQGRAINNERLKRLTFFFNHGCSDAESLPVNVDRFPTFPFLTFVAVYDQAVFVNKESHKYDRRRRTENRDVSLDTCRVE